MWYIKCSIRNSDNPGLIGSQESGLGAFHASNVASLRPAKRATTKGSESKAKTIELEGWSGKNTISSGGSQPERALVVVVVVVVVGERN